MAESRKKSTKSEKSKSARDMSVDRKKKPADAAAKDAKKESNVKAGSSTSSAPPPPKPDAVLSSKPDNQKTPEQVDYEVVSPPEPIDRTHKGIGIGGVLTALIFVALLAGGAYITWPKWSPYVANYIPILEYKQVPDPQLSKLTDRINALEAEARGRLSAEKTISEMEKERLRLQDGVKSLLARLNEVESAVGNVKEMIAATGVGGDSEEARQSFQRISDRLAELEKRGSVVADLTERMNEIEAGGSGDADLAIKRAEEANQRLNQAVSNIESRLTEHEKSRLRSADSPAAAPASAIVLAISQLRKTILSGRPFTKDLEAIQAVSSGDDGIKATLLVLQKHAASGVTTLADLRERFSRTAGSIVAAASEAKGNGWIENVTNRLRSFISIRQIDGSAPEKSVDSLVLRAEDSLKAGDLDGAIKVIDGLGEVSGPARKAASDWLEVAQARQSTERAVSSLHVHAVSLIAATKE